MQLGWVNSLNDDTIGDSLACGKTAAVFLNDMSHIVRAIVVFFFSGGCLMTLLSERNDNTVLQIVQDFCIVSSYEFL
jgi:hypothetical protein